MWLHFLRSSYPLVWNARRRRGNKQLGQGSIDVWLSSSNDNKLCTELTHRRWVSSPRKLIEDDTLDMWIDNEVPASMRDEISLQFVEKWDQLVRQNHSVFLQKDVSARMQCSLAVPFSDHEGTWLIRLPLYTSAGVYSPSGGDYLPYFNRYLSQLMCLYQRPGRVITSG